VGSLLRLVTHDLRNPLAVIISNLGYLGNVLANSGQDVRETLSDTLTSSEDLKHIIENLDLLGQTLAGAQNSGVRSFAVGPVVAEVLGRCQAFAESHGIEVEGLPTSPVSATLVEGTPELLERCLSNLLRNAIAHSRPGSLVSVTLQVSERHCRIHVRDRGTAIDLEKPERMFEPEGQIAAKTELAGRYGRGLGLLCAKLAALAGGMQLGVAPAEAGYPNVFELVLPCSELQGVQG
jgi:signal transduction histidine kinase